MYMYINIFVDRYQFFPSMISWLLVKQTTINWDGKKWPFRSGEVGVPGFLVFNAVFPKISVVMMGKC